jgi:hypothetical protein
MHVDFFEICEISQIFADFYKVVVALECIYFTFLMYSGWLLYIFSLVLLNLLRVC